MAATPLVPVAEDQRRAELDALRGLAIAGVIVANAFDFAYPMLSEFPRGGGPPGRAVEIAVGLLVEGKFYTLLSVLFGIGLLLQSNRAAGRGSAFTAFYLRRLLVLFLIGVAHGVLLYAGDILSYYAIIALVALPFRQLGQRMLRAAAIVTLTLGLLVAGVVDNSAGRPDWERLARGEGSLPKAAAVVLPVLCVEREEFCRFMGAEAEIYRSGSWFEITRHRSIASLLIALPAKLTRLGLYTLGLFLLGMYVAASDFLGRLDALRRLMWPAIQVGLLLEAAGVAWRMATVAGVALLAAGYAAALVLQFSRQPEGFTGRWLIPLGRLALSNYLLQSVLYGFVFYSTGLGRHGRLTPGTVLLIALLVLAGQLQCSVLWRRRFRFGPAEWAWRRLAYRVPLPLSRARV